MTGILERHVLHNIKIKGETASADEWAAKEFPEKLIEDGGYTPDQVWNVDDSGLFWKKNAEQNLCCKIAENCGWF